MTKPSEEMLNYQKHLDVEIAGYREILTCVSSEIKTSCDKWLEQQGEYKTTDALMQKLMTSFEELNKAILDESKEDGERVKHETECRVCIRILRKMVLQCLYFSVKEVEKYSNDELDKKFIQIEKSQNSVIQARDDSVRNAMTSFKIQVLELFQNITKIITTNPKYKLDQKKLSIRLLEPPQEIKASIDQISDLLTKNDLGAASKLIQKLELKDRWNLGHYLPLKLVDKVKLVRLSPDLFMKKLKPSQKELQFEKDRATLKLEQKNPQPVARSRSNSVYDDGSAIFPSSYRSPQAKKR